MSFVLALMLFDSDALETLCKPLRVSICDEHPVSATDIYRGCVLEIFGVSYPIDLIYITLGDVCFGFRAH